MKKSFRLSNLDCANCAAKLERALNRLDGVERATVSFLAQRLSIEAADERFEAVAAEAKALVRKLEPDVTVA